MITKTTLNQKVTAGNVAVPFAILVLGIALALVTLLLEIFADKISCGKVSSEQRASYGIYTNRIICGAYRK